MIDTIRTASEQFWDFLSDIAILPLLAAIGCHLLKLACTSRAWRNVLAAAYPEQHVRWPPILAAYVSGVGINAILPARGGDVVRIFLAHRAIPGSSYTTVVSSTVVLTFVDMTLGARRVRLGADPGRAAVLRRAVAHSRLSTTPGCSTKA